ncbi:MAG TPA: prolipoprotein diacylglyceryl transferase family protein [Ideonella sp.]|uniref:prolipoprotein diacylglyceryl transferase n=1 Tax=Ideonella sp. TaxID=1929293 RepID=UPI002CB4CA54|nr:prolipoprotein diacylglyceryl transferase family protein [Ideonella sp.]HSI48266.1 prolipoprotein diacylglyceryl transferase family protein [Ideonella sp.]
MIALDASTAAWLHGLLEYLGIGVGMALYRRALRADATDPPAAGSVLAPGRFAVMVGLLAGAALGNKAVYLAERPDVAAAWLAGQPAPLGQSIVGGLLGGLIGVELAKAWTGQKASTGDAMVLPLAVGLMIGRVGCFLAGLHDDTYGLPTALPWGVDQGDGVARHPVALYEIGFVALLAAGLWRSREPLARAPGLRFKLFLAAYLLWRLLVDGLKPVPVVYPLGLSGIQWTCALALLLYLPWVARAWRQAVTPNVMAKETPA